MKKLILIIFVLGLSYCKVVGQVPMPERRIFNIGLSNGLGGVNYFLFPSLDLSFKTTSLRVAPGFANIGIGLTQEIIPISKVYYQWKWVVSGYYLFSRRGGTWPGINFAEQSEDVNRYALLTGIKTLFGSRFYSYLQFGLLYSRYSNLQETLQGGVIMDRPAFNEWGPYLEFSVGFNFLRNYSTEIDYSE